MGAHAKPRKPSRGGVYVVWSPDGRRAYVGESWNLRERRKAYDVAIRLGCTFRVVRRMSATKAERVRAEGAYAAFLRRAGVAVVSATMDSDGRLPQPKRGRRLRLRKNATHRQRSQIALQAHETRRKTATPEQRASSIRAGIETRRQRIAARPGPVGVIPVTSDPRLSPTERTAATRHARRGAHRPVDPVRSERVRRWQATRARERSKQTAAA